MITKQAVTAEQFWEMPDVPGKQFELVRGESIEVPGTGYPHALIVMALLRLLDPFVRERKLGRVFADGLSYLVARLPDTVRIPDVSFIAAARIPQEGFRGFVPFAPDIAVEIVSPTDRTGDVDDKVRQYIVSGTLLVWVLWPESQSVAIFTRDGAKRELGPEDELDGGDVLPGFHIRVGKLFEVDE